MKFSKSVTDLSDSVRSVSLVSQITDSIGQFLAPVPSSLLGTALPLPECTHDVVGGVT